MKTEVIPSRTITFEVLGTPAPKGAMTAFPIRKAGALTGRVAVTARSSERQREWTNRVLSVVRGIAEDVELLDEPVVVTMRFYMPKPKAAPKRRRTWPDRAPDIDKLARLVLDAMTGTLLADDARVVELHVGKDYPDNGWTGVEVLVYPRQTA